MVLTIFTGIVTELRQNVSDEKGFGLPARHARLNLAVRG
jgi:hypothetical protein